jgi:hypothetical protein
MKVVCVWNVEMLVYEDTNIFLCCYQTKQKENVVVDNNKSLNIDLVKLNVG